MKLKTNLIKKLTTFLELTKTKITCIGTIIKTKNIKKDVAIIFVSRSPTAMLIDFDWINLRSQWHAC